MDHLILLNVNEGEFGCFVIHLAACFFFRSIITFGINTTPGPFELNLLFITSYIYNIILDVTTRKKRCKFL